MLQTTLQGVSTGMIYAIVGLGFVLVFRTAGLFNFAHAESYTLGALLTFSLVTQLGVPYWLSIPIAGLALAIVGVVTEIIAFRRLLLQNAPPVNVIVASIALGIILRAIAMIIWGPDSQFVEGIGGKIILGESVISGQNALIALMVILVITGLAYLLFNTRLGIGLRAVADKRVIANMMGVDIQVMLPIAFGLAGMLGGVAGSLVAPLLFPQFRMGQNILIKAFSAGVIGGLDSIPGVIVGGLLIGLLETFTGVYITTLFKDVVVFALLITTLIIRPTGILGRESVEKV